MKSLKMLGLCLASMLVVGMTLAGSASAGTALWLLCLEGSNSANTKYEDSSCTKVNQATGKWESVAIGTKSVTVNLQAFTILLLDTKATGGSSGVRCGHPKPLGSGLVEGNVLIIRTAKVETPKTECERVEGGCKAGEVEKLEGVDLPWKAEVSETEGKFLGNLKADGAGEPGWAVECNTLLGKQKDTCKAVSTEPPELFNNSNVVSSGVLLVLAEFLRLRKAECSQGGAGAGLVVGHIATLLAQTSSGSNLGLSLAK